MSDTIEPPACLPQSGPAAANTPTTPAAGKRKRRPPREILLPKIVELALEGHSHYAISRFTDVPRRTVDRWLAQQRRAWAKAAEQTQEELLAATTARLMAVYREAMTAWRASLREKKDGKNTVLGIIGGKAGSRFSGKAGGESRTAKPGLLRTAMQAAATLYEFQEKLRNKRRRGLFGAAAEAETSETAAQTKLIAEDLNDLEDEGLFEMEAESQETESQEKGGGAAHQAEEKTEEKLDFAPNRPFEDLAAPAPAREKTREEDTQKAEGGGQKPEGGGQEPEGGGQKPVGGGRPFKLCLHKKRLRGAFLRSVSQEELDEIIADLVDDAKGGKSAAARLLFDRLFGPPMSFETEERLRKLEARVQLGRRKDRAYQG